ncbi:hypothetical protein XI01_16275 [Bradyrhizobium sp. CCBAU 21360]|nr:hypothetical protein [Bradyrhizobium sp. CCBAU 21360]
MLAEKGRLSQLLINDLKDGPTADTVVNHFGSLTAAYAAVGYQPTPRPAFGMNGRHWSEKAVLSGLRKLHVAHGCVSLRLIGSCPDLPSTCYIREHFGSLDEAMRKAGLPVLNHSDKMRAGWKRRKADGCDDYFAGVHWTDAKLLGALRELHEKHGYTTANLVDQNGITPSAYYYKKRFGSLTKARALAQLPLLTNSQMVSAGRRRSKEGTSIARKPRFAGQRPGMGYCSNDILAGLRRLAERRGVISARMINEDPDLPSSAAVVNHFGKLSTAYQLIGVVRLEGKPIRFGLPPQK